MGQSTADVARQIRDELKAKGWGRNHVSVRSHVYSMGSSVHVRIKAGDVDGDAVEAIAQAHARVRRDEATGEILCGGNLHVSVEWEQSAQVEAGAKHIDALTAAIERLKACPDRTGHEDVAPGVRVGRDGPHSDWFQLWTGSMAGRTFTTAGNGLIAGAFAVEMAIRAQAKTAAAEPAPEPEPEPVPISRHDLTPEFRRILERAVEVGLADASDLFALGLRGLSERDAAEELVRWAFAARHLSQGLEVHSEFCRLWDALSAAQAAH